MADGQVTGDQLRDPRVELELRQVDGGHLVLPRQHLGELGLLDEAELYQVVAEARAAVLLLPEGLLELVSRDHALGDEKLADALDRDRGRWRGHLGACRKERRRWSRHAVLDRGPDW